LKGRAGGEEEAEMKKKGESPKGGAQVMGLSEEGIALSFSKYLFGREGEEADEGEEERLRWFFGYGIGMIDDLNIQKGCLCE